jgi:hypothetical protein
VRSILRIGYKGLWESLGEGLFYRDLERCRKYPVECLEVSDVATRSIWKESRDTWRESILHLEFWSGVAERSG